MLSFLVWFPVLGAIALTISPVTIESKTCRRIALAVSGIIMIATIFLGWHFKPELLEMQFVEDLPWLEYLGLNYQLGLDGLSLPLLFINSLLTFIALYSSSPDLNRPRFYYSLMLLLNAGVTGAFLAQDLLLFFLFYEVEIIPLYFLIAIWGGQKRSYAAMKFLLYTAISGFLVLSSFLGLVWLSGANSFAYEPLRSNGLPLNVQILLLIPLLIGLAIKIPIFPFHTWLPDAHVEASTSVSILLAGVLLKLGTYGLIRFGIGLFLDAWSTLSPYLATIAAISALYGASCAIAQKDMKKVVAYSSIAHMAYVLLAAAASTRLSIIAAIVQMVTHGLISAMLFFLVGLVYKKTGSRDVDYLRGLLNPQKGMPITGSLMILAAMASAGIPGLAGFIAEFLVFRSSFPIFPIQTLMCLIGSGLTAVYFLLMINRVFFGRLTPELAKIPRIYWWERIPSLTLAILILFLGIQPNWLVRWSEPQAGLLLLGKSELSVNISDNSPSLAK